MPFVINNPQVLAGFSLSNSRAGGNVEVAHRGFVTSDDGQRLTDMLHQLTATYLRQIPRLQAMFESQVDHFLIVSSKDPNRATIFLNELSFVSDCLGARGIQAGQVVTSDDLLDIVRTEILGVTIGPTD